MRMWLLERSAIKASSDNNFLLRLTSTVARGYSPPERERAGMSLPSANALLGGGGQDSLFERRQAAGAGNTVVSGRYLPSTSPDCLCPRNHEAAANASLKRSSIRTRRHLLREGDPQRDTALPQGPFLIHESETMPSSWSVSGFVHGHEMRKAYSSIVKSDTIIANEGVSTWPLIFKSPLPVLRSIISKHMFVGFQRATRRET